MVELRPTVPDVSAIPGVSPISSMGLVLVKSIANLDHAGASFAKAIDVEELPQPGKIAEGGRRYLAGLAPGEWLLFGPKAPIALVSSDLSKIEPASLLCADLSHARIVLALHSGKASDILAAHSPLNTDAVLQPGCCAQTRFGDIRVFLARPRSTDDIVMIFEPSVTAYVTALLGRPR